MSTQCGREQCQFFVDNGYCTLGSECQLLHVFAAVEHPRDIDICFAINTSNAQFMSALQAELESISKALFSADANVRMSMLFSCGDKECVQTLDFTAQEEQVLKFIADSGEPAQPQEVPFWAAVDALSWNESAASKLLILVGDSIPFQASSQEWQRHCEALRQRGCIMHDIFCGAGGTNDTRAWFYQQVSLHARGAFHRIDCVSELGAVCRALCTLYTDDVAEGISTVCCASTLRRLTYDLQRVQQAKLCNVAVHVEKETLSEWHVNVQPTQGPFFGVHIHLVLDFSAGYPFSPPLIQFLASIPNAAHPRIVDNTLRLTAPNEVVLGVTNTKSDAQQTTATWTAESDIVSLLKQLVRLWENISEVEDSGAGGNAEDSRVKADANENDEDDANTNTNTNVHDIGHTNKKKRSRARRRRRTSALKHRNHKVKQHAVRMSTNMVADIKASIEQSTCHCGHSACVVYPAMASDLLPFELVECDTRNQRITDKHARGMLVAGPVLDTLETGRLCKVKTTQGITRQPQRKVAWQFTIDAMHDDDDDTTTDVSSSQYIFGLDCHDKNGGDFFGVSSDGSVCFNNNLSSNEMQAHELQPRDTVSFVLQFAGSGGGGGDELYMFVNFRYTGHTKLPPPLLRSDVFNVVMYLKNVRVRLELNSCDCDKLNKAMSLSLSAPFRIIAFNDLQSQSPQLQATKPKPKEKRKKRPKHQKQQPLSPETYPQIWTRVFEFLPLNALLQCVRLNRRCSQIVADNALVERHRIRCVYTKHSMCDAGACLGVELCVNWSNWGNPLVPSIVSDMKFVSLSAFVDSPHNHRSDDVNRVWYFLPLVLHQQHADSAASCIRQRLSMLCSSIPNQLLSTDALFDAMQIIMNQFVVRLMHDMEQKQSSDNKNDDADNGKLQSICETALSGYCALHHMLLWFVARFPDMKQLAKYRVEQFLQHAWYRERRQISDLGIFLLNLSVCDNECDWNTIASVLLDEWLDRGTSVYMPKCPELEYMDDVKCSSEERMRSTFACLSQQCALLRFQVWFLQHVCNDSKCSPKSEIMRAYERRCGRPSQLQTEMLTQQMKKHCDSTRNDGVAFFKQLGLGDHDAFGNMGDICAQLKQSIRRSANKHYYFHNNSKLFYAPSHNVMINYLPQSMTEETMATMFSAYGTQIRVKIIRDPVTNISRCYGFVQFENEWDADHAVAEMNGYQISGKTLKVTFAVKTPMMTKTTMHAGSFVNTNFGNTNVYIQNIPLSFTDSDLEALFIRYGQIADFTILRTENGVSRGVGFVRYYEKTDAFAAIKGQNNTFVTTDLEDCVAPLYVKWARFASSTSSSSSGGESIASSFSLLSGKLRTDETVEQTPSPSSATTTVQYESAATTTSSSAATVVSAVSATNSASTTPPPTATSSTAPAAQTQNLMVPLATAAPVANVSGALDINNLAKLTSLLQELQQANAFPLPTSIPSITQLPRYSLQVWMPVVTKNGALNTTATTLTTAVAAAPVGYLLPAPFPYNT